MSSVVADVADVAAKLRADATVVTEPAVLLGDVEALLGIMSSVQAVIVDRLRAVIETDATVQLCGRSVKAWLVEEQLLASADAGRYVRLARRLTDAPVAREAFDTAEIGAAHAAAVLTALNTLPPEVRDTVEPVLVEQAKTCPPEQICGFTDELLDRLGLNKASEIRRERRYTSRGLDLARGLHGGWALTGTLTPEAGAALAAALRTAGLGPADMTLGPGHADDRTVRQRRHDALLVIADRYQQAAGTPSTTGAPGRSSSP